MASFDEAVGRGQSAEGKGQSGKRTQAPNPEVTRLQLFYLRGWRPLMRQLEKGKGQRAKGRANSKY